MILAAAIAVAAVAAGATLSAAHGLDRSARSAAAGATVKIRINGDWGNWDFQTLTEQPNLPPVSAGYDTLLAYAPNSGSGAAPKLVPYLASSWKTKPTSVTFVIRKGPRCADGSPITAGLVAQSLQRFVKVSNALGTSWGPGSYTITANNGARTVTVSSSLPNNLLIYGVGTQQVVCPQGINNPTSLQTNMYGSGPYQLTSAVHGSSVTMKLNTQWTWGPNGTTAKTAGMPGTIVFVPVTNETTAANLLLTGGLDMAEVSGPDVSRLLASNKFNVLKTHQYLTYDLEFNLRTNHQTADFWLRHALSLLVNTSDYNKAEFDGRGITSTSFVTSDTQCFDPATRKYAKTGSVAQAKAILMAHGYKYSGSQLMSPQGQPVKISFLKLSTMASGIDYIASVWQQLGIPVSIKTDTYTQWVTDGLAGNWDAWVNTEFASYANPGTGSGFISGPGYPKGYNSNGMQDNNVVENMAAQARAAKSVKAGCHYWDEFQETMLKDRYITPLSAPYVYAFVRKGISAQIWGPGTPALGPDIRSLRVAK
jgi:peptide/nickel transport system substrate-binding protein